MAPLAHAHLQTAVSNCAMSYKVFNVGKMESCACRFLLLVALLALSTPPFACARTVKVRLYCFSARRHSCEAFLY